MARRMLSVLLTIVIAIIVIGFMLPREVVVQRSQTMEVESDIAFAVLEDLSYFNVWSPWHSREQADRYRLEGPMTGEGATLVWSDEGGGGSGRLWITRSDAPEAIDLQMEQGGVESNLFFRIAPNSGDSDITWGMRMQFGTFDLTGRYIGLMLPGLVGRDLERGLATLKSYLESHGGEVPPRPSGLTPSDFPDRDERSQRGP